MADRTQSSAPLQGASVAPKRQAFAPSQLWRLDAAGQTLVLGAQADRLPEAVYWGAPLPGSEDLATLAAAHQIDIAGGMLDETPDLSLCPDAARSFPGQPGLVCRAADGAPLSPRFVFEGAEENAGLMLAYRDGHLGLRLVFSFEADAQTGLITAQSRLESAAPIWLDWLCAPALPAPQAGDEMIDVSGRWCREFQLNTTPWRPGIRARESRIGRTGHEHFPALLLPASGAINTRGEVWGLHYGWSGGHRMIAEELADGRRQIQFGNAFGAEPAPAQHFETAPLYLSYSDTGLNGCATAFQRHLRDRIITWPRPATARPVHYNCWEAVYFDHSLDTLKDIAARAAAIGAERFVLDDGWFGQRNDDTAALGDWWVDPQKYPDGLTPLIDHVQSLGMGFGLWFELEMINLDSDLYRTHPDWLLGAPDQIAGRNQYALDMARGEVRDYLYDKIAALLAAHPIDYIKWDHNRVLPAPDAAQTRGSYALLDRLRADFPQVEIESCASGGGRIDFGILSRTQRVWLSDSNDALERLRIQHDAALFLPSVVTGSHVGPRRCHTSGRVLDIGFRAWVAAQRHMGFEMDPRELDAREEAVLRDVTAWWKANRGWMAEADILRLDSADPAVIAEQQLARDGARFVVFAGQSDTLAQTAPRPLRLTGLDPQARYRLRLVNRDSIDTASRGHPILKHDAITVSGAWLMGHGLSLPCAFPQTVWVLEGDRV